METGSGNGPKKSPLSDFDAIRARKKQERSGSQRRENITEEQIYDILERMKHAALKDRELHRVGQLATQKILLLNEFATLLQKRHLQSAFLEQGVLRIIALWLKPLSDDHLPPYAIRQTLLKVLLHNYKCLNKRHLMESKLGKIILNLSSHPEELIANRLYARKLVERWARDVYNIRTDYRGMSSKDRLRLAMERGSKQATVDGIAPEETGSSGNNGETVAKQWIDIPVVEETTSQAHQPTKTDSVSRARVPMPAANAYVNRPPSNIGESFNINPAQMQKCEQILERFFQKKNKK